MTVFDNEIDDMTAAAREQIPAVFPVDADAWVEEFPYGKGTTYRTDIAAIDRDPAALQARVDAGVGVAKSWEGPTSFDPLNSKWRYLKSYLWLRERAPISKSAWMDDTYYRTNRSEIWDWLSRHNYLQPVDDRFGAPFDVADVPYHGDQYAFELKPKDWEKALFQAQRSVFGWDMDAQARLWADCRTDVLARNRGYPFRHGGYADFAVVVLDADHIEAALANADQFRYYGVGLASLDRDSLEVHVDPQRQAPCPLSKNRLDLNERTLPSDQETLEEIASAPPEGVSTP